MKRAVFLVFTAVYGYEPVCETWTYDGVCCAPKAQGLKKNNGIYFSPNRS